MRSRRLASMLVVMKSETLELDRTPAREILVLDRDECVSALRGGHVGRVVVVLPNGAPVIRPVNYVFDVPSQSIVFRTDFGSKLYALLQSRAAWFEVDEIDLPDQAGWSVIVAGASEEVISTHELERLGKSGPTPWVPGTKHRWFMIHATTVSGRRVIPTPNP